VGATIKEGPHRPSAESAEALAKAEAVRRIQGIERAYVPV